MNNLYNILSRKAAHSPDQIAYIVDGKKIPYSKLILAVDNLANHMKSSGIKESDHVCVISNNSIEFASLFWSCAKIGCVIIPLMPSYRNSTVTNLMKQTSSRFIFIENRIQSKYKEIIENYQLLEFPDFRKLCENTGTQTRGDSEIDSKCNFLITLTSGSTSSPKPIILTQENKICRSIDSCRDVYSLSSKEITIVSTPMYHSLGIRMVLLPIILGGTGVILTDFTPEKWVNEVFQNKVSFAIVVSNQIKSILSQLINEKVNFSHQIKIVSSSAKLNINIKEEFKRYINCKFFECYGTSEVGIVTSSEFTINSDDFGSVGKSIHNVQIKILNENHSECPTSQKGEIAVKTKTMFSGYFGLEENQNYIKNDYFMTGDIGSIDEAGNLYYHGRINDTIKSGAINVYPQDVEKVISNFPGVLECAVVGRECLNFGQVPVAFVCPSRSSSFSKSELRKYCLKHLADYQIPRDFILKKTLPKNKLGKLQRFKLTN